MLSSSCVQFHILAIVISFQIHLNSDLLFIFEFRYVETAFAQNVSDLPTRYLPPGTVKMLFYEFNLTNKSVSFLCFGSTFMWWMMHGTMTHSICLCSLLLLAPPRYLTFWRRYKSVWANILRFLPQTSHAACDVCLDCKESFKVATEPTLCSKVLLQNFHSTWAFDKVPAVLEFVFKIIGCWFPHLRMLRANSKQLEPIKITCLLWQLIATSRRCCRLGV